MKLFKWGKKKDVAEHAPQLEDVKPPVESQSKVEEAPEHQSAPEPKPEKVKKVKAKAAPKAKVSWFQRLKQGLNKTRQAFGGGLKSVITGRKIVDADLLDELETVLLTADVGVEATTDIIDQLTEQVDRNILKTPEALLQSLRASLSKMLSLVSQPLVVDEAKRPYVILMVGVNGAGKTTTIGKLANQFKQQGKSVMLAAGDTFRAAAVEQLQVWGERNDVPVVAQHAGADSASVIFDTVQAAQARGVDIVIADTAGRLHTKSNLMAELEKVVRVMKKLDDSAPHEIMLVLDAGMGQNALSQAEQFHQAVGINGITLTKLDGTAKGGIIFAIAKKLELPVRYIGVGESIDDLKPFVADEFVAALFDE